MSNPVHPSVGWPVCVVTLPGIRIAFEHCNHARYRRNHVRLYFSFGHQMIGRLTAAVDPQRASSVCPLGQLPLNLGDILFQGDDTYGDGVNLSAGSERHDRSVSANPIYRKPPSRGQKWTCVQIVRHAA